jgi:hypothetical protein
MISAYLTLPLIRKGMCASFEGLVKEVRCKNACSATLVAVAAA